MQKGFIPLVVVAIIGLISVLTAGGGYAAYRYNEVAKEKAVVEAQLSEQKDKEILRLQEQVEARNQESETSNQNISTTSQATSTETTSTKKDIPQETKNKAIETVTKKAANVSPVVNPIVNTTTKPTGTLCNGKYWNACAAGLVFNCPQTGGDAICSIPPSGTNYHSQATQDVNRIIALYEGLKDFMNDTEDELRDARKTLNGFPSGGLVGQSRDANLGLVEAELHVASGMLDHANERIIFWEGLKNILDSQPTGFIDQASYEKMQTPDSVEKDINIVKKKTNSSLESVNEGIQAVNNALYSL